MDQYGTWHGGSLSPGDFALDGDPAPLPQIGAEPPVQFSAQFYFGQMAGCINMPLGMDVGLSPLNPRDFVIDGDPVLLPKKGTEPPSNFRSIFIVTKRLDG